MAVRMTLYKLVVLGGASVGKTTLTVQLCLNHFIETYDPTIEDSYRKQVVIDGQSCMLEVLDTAGQEEYTGPQDQWIRDSEGFLLVYSISSRSSFTQIQKFHDRIQCVKESLVCSPSLSRSPPSVASPERLVPVMLVGNKSDKVTERKVSTGEGHALAKKLGCAFVESSAKNYINVEKAFYSVVKLLRHQHQQSARQLPGRTGTGMGSNGNFWNHWDPYGPRDGKKCVIL